MKFLPDDPRHLMKFKAVLFSESMGVGVEK